MKINSFINDELRTRYGIDVRDFAVSGVNPTSVIFKKVTDEFLRSVPKTIENGRGQGYAYLDYYEGNKVFIITDLIVEVDGRHIVNNGEDYGLAQSVIERIMDLELVTIKVIVEVEFILNCGDPDVCRLVIHKTNVDDLKAAVAAFRAEKSRQFDAQSRESKSKILKFQQG